MHLSCLHGWPAQKKKNPQARSSKWGCILKFSAHKFRKSEVSLGYILRLHISRIFLIDVTKHPTNQLKGEDLFWLNTGEGALCGGSLWRPLEWVGVASCGCCWKVSGLLTSYLVRKQQRWAHMLYFLFLRRLDFPDDVLQIQCWSFLLS